MFKKYNSIKTLKPLIKLAAVMLTSPHAHARIRSIDTSAAEALEGVKAVVTGADFTLPEDDFYRDVAVNCMAQDAALYDGHAVAAVAAVSEAVAAWMEEEGLGDHTKVVHNGVEVPSDQTDRVRARKDLGLPPDGIVIGLFSQLVEHKGALDFLAAHRHAVDLHEDVMQRRVETVTALDAAVEADQDQLACIRCGICVTECPRNVIFMSHL